MTVMSSYVPTFLIFAGIWIGLAVIYECFIRNDVILWFLKYDFCSFIMKLWFNFLENIKVCGYTKMWFYSFGEKKLTLWLWWKMWFCRFGGKLNFDFKNVFFGFGGFSRKCDYTILVGKCKYYNLAENEILAKKNVILRFWQKKM